MVSESFLKIFIAFSIIIGGYILSEVISYIVLQIRRSMQHTTTIASERKFKDGKYIIMTFAIALALFYLKAPVIDRFLTLNFELITDLFATFLILVLGIILVNLVISLLSKILSSVGFEDYLAHYGGKHFFNAMVTILRIILYLLVLDIVLGILGTYFTTINNLVRIILFALIGIAAIISYFSLKPMGENIAAGFYLKSLPQLKRGTKIHVFDTEGEIKSVTNIHTIIKTDSGRLMIIPNKEMVATNIQFDQTKNDLETLEEIKNYFVAQTPSACGPACAEMTLAIFGYKTEQKELGEMMHTVVGKGSHPSAMKHAIEKATNKKVVVEWIGFDKIYDLKNEIKSWLADGGLIIVDFKKKFVFPTAKKAHYAVVVGVEGDDLVMLDPSAKQGGVYLVNFMDIYLGMDTYSELIEGKRGYLILAPAGTTAHMRIKEGILYTNPDLYVKMSKTLDRKMQRVLRKSTSITTVFPGFVKDYLNKWHSQPKVSRLWHPESEK